MNRKIITATIIALITVVPLSAMALAGAVPDTGQTKCYDDNQEIPCPQPGQPFYGQDSQYSTNPHSYTDLGNGVIRDNVTGLEWQKDTAPGTYTWDQANTYCADLTLGGYSDWRLPTIKELSNLVDSSIPYPGPTINTTYFPGTQAASYWSSTTSAPVPGEAWFVSFGSGLVNTYGKSYNGYYVRAVRGGTQTNQPPIIESEYFIMPGHVDEGETVSFSFRAYDPEGTATLKFYWRCGGFNVGSAMTNRNGTVVEGDNTSQYTAAYVYRTGNDTCTLTVCEDSGGACGLSTQKTGSITIYAVENVSCNSVDGIQLPGEQCDESAGVYCTPDTYLCDDCQCVHESLFEW